MIYCFYITIDERQRCVHDYVLCLNIMEVVYFNLLHIKFYFFHGEKNATTHTISSPHPRWYGSNEVNIMDALNQPFMQY